MLLHIPKVLTESQVGALPRGSWRTPSGWTAARPPATCRPGSSTTCRWRRATPEAREMGDVVVTALERTPLFMSAALPLRVFPPLFNRYEPGMAFGAHVDNAIRAADGQPAARAHRPVGDAVPEPPRGVRRRRAGGRRHLRRPRGQAARRRHDPLPGLEPAPGQPGHARRAPGVDLLGAEHGGATTPSARCCSISTWRSARSPRPRPTAPRWSRSPAATTTCCGAGREV